MRTERTTGNKKKAKRPKRGNGSRSPLQSDWAAAIEDPEWNVYCRAIETLRAAGLPAMVGGGFALATYTGRWRDTKDIDFYLLPEQRERASSALLGAGFKDYYERRAYDRNWIYRSVQANVIVDVIWAMANQRTQVDSLWLDRARTVNIRGEELLVIPLEEFIWCKLYIIQRDRCDWTDVINLVYANVEVIDWEHLLKRLDTDAALLQALLTVFSWLCPDRAGKIPEWFWERLHRLKARERPNGRGRIRLLDSRRWFAALLAPGEKLEV